LFKFEEGDVPPGFEKLTAPSFLKELEKPLELGSFCLRSLLTADVKLGNFMGLFCLDTLAVDASGETLWLFGTVAGGGGGSRLFENTLFKNCGMENG
jgi:hypothetical protein